jgi:hypothetical protein
MDTGEGARALENSENPGTYNTASHSTPAAHINPSKSAHESDNECTRLVSPSLPPIYHSVAKISYTS